MVKSKSQAGSGRPVYHEILPQQVMNECEREQISVLKDDKTCCNWNLSIFGKNFGKPLRGKLVFYGAKCKIAPVVKHATHRLPLPCIALSTREFKHGTLSRHHMQRPQGPNSMRLLVSVVICPIALSFSRFGRN